MRLHDLVEYLDDYLRLGESGDWANALNGLQVENAGEVRSIACAVDACEAVIREACNLKADLLLVHHGLFWNGLEPIRGRTYRKFAALLKHDLAVYSAHLPLDRHPEVGNNFVLARQLGVDLRGTWAEEKGAEVGAWGDLETTRSALTARLAELLGAPPRVLPGGDERIRRVGVVTGAGGSLIQKAKDAGLDAFVTGEGAHHTYFDAEELGINVFYAGHYATETVGVKMLGRHLGDRFGLAWHFIDHPTGL
jgi:dinuclear metal center YbgI/SA1388 family protein